MTQAGDAGVDALMPLVYDRLRGFAAKLIGPGVARVAVPPARGGPVTS